jgi:hypothetical protein
LELGYTQFLTDQCVYGRWQSLGCKRHSW